MTAPDPAFAALQPLLHSAPGPLLWVADENARDAVTLVTPREDLQLITNRHDVAIAAAATGHRVQFSDFDVGGFASRSVQGLAYRVSKEKPVVHHVLNHAPRLLADGGCLLLAGLKEEGTRTYIDKCRQHFGNGSHEKHGTAYLGRCLKPVAMADNAWLDDQQYSTLRLIHTGELDFFSKPGTFGWNRVDAGSALLVDALPGALQGCHHPPHSLLDLGCGYGYLTLATRHLPVARRVATDNAAAALLAMQANADRYQLDVAVIASDAGDAITERFDLVLSNPPFHQGFSTDHHLVSRFLQQAKRLLAPDGIALFVASRSVPLATLAAPFFTRHTLLAENRMFRVLGLRH